MLRILKKMSCELLNVFAKPKEVFIPLIIDNDESITVLVKKGDYVYKGQMIGRKKDGTKLGIFSSVSGVVEDIISKKYITGKLVKCVQIKNDFKEHYQEKRRERKNLNISSEEFIKILKENGIVSLSDGKIVYKMYEKKCRTLVVNAFEGDPYFNFIASLLHFHADEVLDAIDNIMKINGMDEAIFVLNSLDTISISSVNNYIGTYDRIKVVTLESDFISGFDECLLNRLGLKNSKVIVNDVLTIYAIYEALRYDVPLTQRIITIAGDGFKKPQNVLVKNGTSVLELVEFVGGYKRFNYNKMCLVSGNSMLGLSMEDDDFVVGLNLSGVLALKMPYEFVESPCIKCGKCIDNCPKNINPILIVNSSNHKKMLKKLDAHKCIGCGLCSYVCPSKIQLRDKILELKDGCK